MDPIKNLFILKVMSAPAFVPAMLNTEPNGDFTNPHIHMMWLGFRIGFNEGVSHGTANASPRVTDQTAI